MERKDRGGRKLRTGEYYDSENDRYIFRKLVNGSRYTLTENDLTELRKKESNLLVEIEKREQDLDRIKRLTLDQYFEIWCKNFAKSGRKATTYTDYKAYYIAHVKNTELGKKEIRKIKKMDCQRLFSKMIEKCSKGSTLNNMKGCLTLIFTG